MRLLFAASAALALAQASPAGKHHAPKNEGKLRYLTDINVISKYWGEISPYSDNAEDLFGVEDVGLPDGCQIEQVHTFQRHANRFPTSAWADGENNDRFADKVLNFTTSANSSTPFRGPLAFLNNYEYLLGESLLTGVGALTEFQSGVNFWNRYGRILYNATAGQLAYNASFSNGTARPKPVLRTTSQSRIQNSQINWALGFFGDSFQAVPDPTFANATDAFDVVIIPEGGTENSTLAAYDPCFNDWEYEIGYLGDYDMYEYIPKYLGPATARLQQHAPKGFTFTTNDTYAMQNICAYEHNYIGMSDFCSFFTEDEWTGYENTLDIQYYYDYAWGNPTARAQGIGYVQELIARLTDQYITVSNSSVNSTLDDNDTTFPLNQPFYADISHDDIILSILTAMSLDYFKDPPSLTQYPPDPHRRFILSQLTPFGARLITEVIGCGSTDPEPVSYPRVQYTPTQYGYNPANATNKFIRMRLNNGILPLNTLRGGQCGNATAGTGRTDGLCALDQFLATQQDSYKLANYDYACFGNYTLSNITSGHDYDGTIYQK
ncbi:3-phytase [Xylona heveae TC161]|uniref:3-phytase n=1 Tax=Xylona heveae (strain CBS 132557 / TC161) TaxID=1328760 RepID=A0A165AFX0_XYLHT|nr:3-phytase [Xylona heveae TC161]KZF20409.1 3-phytase [Xylona heveae TC161]